MPFRMSSLKLVFVGFLWRSAKCYNQSWQRNILRADFACVHLKAKAKLREGTSRQLDSTKEHLENSSSQQVASLGKVTGMTP